MGRHRAAPPGLPSSGGFQGAPITRCRGGERLDGGLGFHKGEIPPGAQEISSQNTTREALAQVVKKINSRAGKRNGGSVSTKHVSAKCLSMCSSLSAARGSSVFAESQRGAFQS